MQNTARDTDLASHCTTARQTNQYACVIQTSAPSSLLCCSRSGLAQQQHVVAGHLDNSVGKLKAKLDAHWLQVALAPLLHAVFHHVGHHRDQHIQWVELVPAHSRNQLCWYGSAGSSWKAKKRKDYPFLALVQQAAWWCTGLPKWQQLPMCGSANSSCLCVDR